MQRANLVQGLWGDDAVTITGFFVNRNMYAAALYCSIPFLVALVLPELRKSAARRILVALLAAAYLGIIIAGLAQSQSRAGFILAILAVFAIIPLELSKRGDGDGRGVKANALAIWAVIGGVVIVGQLGLVAASRLAATDPLVDYRYHISSTAFRAMREFFPVGSGFGTFVPVYKMFEQPEAIMRGFVNHAHNDWLEIALEGGLPAMLLLVSFLLWFVAAAVRSWRIGGNSAADLVPRAASIAAAGIMIQSIVDYPLRDPNLMSLFAIGLGFMAGQPVRKPLQRPRHHHASSSIREEAAETVRRPIPRFGGRAATSDS
jgi:O-antigen ligase